MMKPTITLFATLILATAWASSGCGAKEEKTMDSAQAAKAVPIHDIVMTDIDGGQKALRDFAGKTLLIVNTASECGLTPQYEGLEKLAQTYGARGLTVLGVPSNDFGGQEPGSDAQIKTFCSERFHVTFPMLSKVKVTGDDKAALYETLTEHGPEATRGAIKWNFTKFLVDSKGTIVGRFAPQTEPLDLSVTSAIEAELAKTP
jgi:glutathione peroxidase